jgi:hypothetical protein
LRTVRTNLFSVQLRTIAIGARTHTLRVRAMKMAAVMGDEPRRATKVTRKSTQASGGVYVYETEKHTYTSVSIVERCGMNV